MKIQQDLSAKLQQSPGKVSLTFDGWTSAVMTAYIAVTAHYITEDWELAAELLAFEEQPGSHSGENLAECLYTIVDRNDIGNKVL